MVIIRFPDEDTERKALGFLAGRASFKTRDDGETMVPSRALPLLANRGITFTVIGQATYEQVTPIRDLAAHAV